MTPDQALDILYTYARRLAAAGEIHDQIRVAGNVLQQYLHRPVDINGSVPESPVPESPEVLAESASRDSEG